MSMQPYPTYRDSGVPWLRKTPAHWNLTRMRFIARFNPSKSEIGNLPPETEISFLPMDAIGEDGSLRLDATRPLSAVEQGYTYFRDGDLLIAKITPCFENGKGALAAGLLGGIGFGTTELIVVRPLPGTVVADYLHWLFVGPDFRNAGTAAMYGAGGQKRIPDEFVRNFVLALPPPAEQRAIATFLDRECGKIDTLVAEQEQLIALLKEKRQAIISQTVTKGLDPTALLEDCGVEWPKKKPRSWTICRVSSIVDIVNGFPFDASNFDLENGVPLIRIRDLNSKTTAVRFAGLPVESAFVTKADLLIGMDGDFNVGRWLGETPALLNQRVCCLRGQPEILRWLEYVIPIPLRRINNLAYSTTVKHLSSGEVRKILISMPSNRDELDKVIAFLDCECSKIDTLIAESESAIALLKERRIALISAAVTGQIDVRNPPRDP